MSKKHDRFEWIAETMSIYKGTIRFLLGLAVAVLSIFLYLSQPAQGAILSKQIREQDHLLQTTRDEIAVLSIQISRQITLDKVQEYAREKGLQFGDSAHTMFISNRTEAEQTAMRR